MSPKTTRTITIIRLRDLLADALTEAATLRRVGGAPGEGLDAKRISVIAALQAEACAELDMLTGRRAPVVVYDSTKTRDRDGSCARCHTSTSVLTSGIITDRGEIVCDPCAARAAGAV